jgi:hypothetical protein
MNADSRGGKREGAGRRPGTKNKVPKNTSKITGKEAPEAKVNKAVDEANKNFIDGLSGDMKKLYKGFSKRHKLPLDDLRELAQSMKARYNIGLRSEIEQHGSAIKLAEEEREEILETGLLYGQKASKTKIDNKLRGLEKAIMSKYHISSSLTTLSAELKNLFVEIERIEAGQPSGNVNIFNLLQGKGDAEKVDALEEEIFRPDPSIFDEEDIEETNEH